MSQTITLKALTGSQIGAAEQIAALFPGSTVTKTTATFVGDLGQIAKAISDGSVAAKAEKRAAGHNAAAPHWDRLAFKFGEALVALPAPEPTPEPEVEAPAKKVYAPAVKAQGKKDWAKAARLYRKYGTVKAVADEMGCSSTAAARWIRNGLAV